MNIGNVARKMVGCIGVGVLLTGAGMAQTAKPADNPWMNTALDADARADLMVKAMTLDEKISACAWQTDGVCCVMGDPVAAAQQPWSRVCAGGSTGWDCRIFSWRTRLWV